MVAEQGQRIALSCWRDLHFREAPQTKVWVIRLLREAAQGSKRDPRERWFIWTGQQDIPLEQGCPCSRKRCSQALG